MIPHDDPLAPVVASLQADQDERHAWLHREADRIRAGNQAELEAAEAEVGRLLGVLCDAVYAKPDALLQGSSWAGRSNRIVATCRDLIDAESEAARLRGLLGKDGEHDDD